MNVQSAARSTIEPHSVDSQGGARQHAEKTAAQFEAILVRQLVSSLRETSSFGQEGGLFGNGAGSGTYADWFDQHLSEHLSASDQIGVKRTIIEDLERLGQLEKPDVTANSALAARRVADRAHFVAMSAIRGGIDVTQ